MSSDSEKFAGGGSSSSSRSSSMDEFSFASENLKSESKFRSAVIVPNASRNPASSSSAGSGGHSAHMGGSGKCPFHADDDEMNSPAMESMSSRSSSTTVAHRSVNKTILNSLAYPVIVANKALSIILVSDSFCNQFGYREEQLLGKNVKEIIPKESEHHRNHDMYFSNYSNSGRTHLIGIGRILPVARGDGTVVLAEINLSKATISGEDEGAYFASFRVVSGMMNASLDLLPSPIVVTDGNCTVKYANKALLAMLGLDERLEIVGKNLAEFVLEQFSTSDKTSHSLIFLFEDPLSQLVPKKVSPSPKVLHLISKTQQDAVPALITVSESREPAGISYFFSMRPRNNSAAGGSNNDGSDLATPGTLHSPVSVTTDESFRTDGSHALLRTTRKINLDTADVPALKAYLRSLQNQLQAEEGVRVRLEQEAILLRAKLIEARKSSSRSLSTVSTSSQPQFHLINPKEIIIKEKIGSGGFAKVYRAVWLGKEVALKKLKAEKGVNVDEAFSKEMGLLASLRHPNVVLMLGACQGSKGDSIVTEYLSGGSLFHYLRTLREQGRLMDAADLRRFALEIAMGMAYLHSIVPPIIHRDLKSLNVLLDANRHCKVADFGLSRVMLESAVNSASIGSPHWMAPEALRGERYTVSVDVYSYGILLWEMVTTEPPYEGMNSFVIVSRMIHEDNFRPVIPDWARPYWAELIRSCWHQDPSKRPTFTGIIEYINQNVPANIGL